MVDESEEIRRVKIEPPLPEDLIEELIDFWEAAFDTPFGHHRYILRGDERESNRDILYCLWDSGRLLGTSHLTVSVSVPYVGGFGEVATQPDATGRGIATELSEKGLNDFRSDGGHALFLGTGNPAAARIYHRDGIVIGRTEAPLVSSGDAVVHLAEVLDTGEWQEPKFQERAAVT